MASITLLMPVSMQAGCLGKEEDPLDSLDETIRMTIEWNGSEETDWSLSFLALYQDGAVAPLLQKIVANDDRLDLRHEDGSMWVDVNISGPSPVVIESRLEYHGYRWGALNFGNTTGADPRMPSIFIEGPDELIGVFSYHSWHNVNPCDYSTYQNRKWSIEFNGSGLQEWVRPEPKYEDYMNC